MIEDQPIKSGLGVVWRSRIYYLAVRIPSFAWSFFVFSAALLPVRIERLETRQFSQNRNDTRSGRIRATSRRLLYRPIEQILNSAVELIAIPPVNFRIRRRLSKKRLSNDTLNQGGDLFAFVM